MAMETKILEVKNSEETRVIEYWSQFGWQLKSSQRIYNKDSHIERRGDDIVNVTETVDFTKIILERDKSNPNYDTIVKLEDEYMRKSKSLPTERPKVGTSYSSMEEWARGTNPDVRNKKQRLISTVITLVGIALSVILLLLDAGILFTIPLIVGLIVAGVVKKKDKKSMLNQTLEGSYPEGVSMLENFYNNYQKAHSDELEAAARYDADVSRLNEILRTLKKLV